MAKFLKGNFQVFYKTGSYECVRDTIRFQQTGDKSIYFTLSKRDMETYLKRYIRSEFSNFKLIPLDEQQPHLGGKVLVTTLDLNWVNLTPAYKKQYGVYGDNFLSYGTAKGKGDVLDDEAKLL